MTFRADFIFELEIQAHFLEATKLLWTGGTHNHMQVE